MTNTTEKANEPATLDLANTALLEGRFDDALRGYLRHLVDVPKAAGAIAFNISLARRRYRAARPAGEQRTVVVSFGGNGSAAARSTSLARAHGATLVALGPKAADVDGALTLPVSTRTELPGRLLSLVCGAPADVIRLSLPCASSVLTGLLYRLVWDARVVFDLAGTLDAKEGAETLPEWPAPWRPDAALVRYFPVATVDRPELQARFGGTILEDPAATLPPLPAVSSMALGSLLDAPLNAAFDSLGGFGAFAAGASQMAEAASSIATAQRARAAIAAAAAQQPPAAAPLAAVGAPIGAPVAPPEGAGVSRFDTKGVFPSPAAAREFLAEVLARKLDGKPKKLFPDFDTAAEDKIIAAAAEIYRADPARFEAIKVSVVMPTYNRGDRIGPAIASVLAQTHRNLELLVVDDGSTDNTRKIMQGYGAEPRVRPFWNDHGGVSAARNTALENAVGDYVFYLDSDNLWTPDFLAVMVVAFDVSGQDVIYGATKLTNPREIVGYRGEPFNWDQCLSGNYVDMNVLGHRRSLIDTCGGFDAQLERMVDWDLVLRFTRDRGAAYCPVLGCIYFEDSEDAGRISTSKPYIYRAIVQEKNRKNFGSAAETLDQLSIRFALKIPAPFAVRHAWGDFHYASSLQAALEKLGHRVRIDFLEDWDKHAPNTSDVVIVLRGLSSYIPKPTEFSVLWNISHPDQITYEEYNLYNIVCVASTSYAELLSKVLGRSVVPLLQCTDSRTFAFREPGNRHAAPGVFIGNSRNQYRTIVKWTVEAGVTLDIYGDRWEKFVPAGMVRKANLPNEELADVYAGGRFVLNDHWASMQDFGLISNRIFDVVGCGGRLISDEIPSVARLFDGVVEMIEGPEELAAAVGKEVPPASRALRAHVAAKVHAHHSFDARAAEIVRQVRMRLLKREDAGGDPVDALLGYRRKRIGLLLQNGKSWPTSSAFIRLIAPLTSDYAGSQFKLVYLNDAYDPRLAECDLCIVQRIAVPEHDEATHLLAQLESYGIPLYIDTDDAFSFHDKHRDNDVVLKRLMARAQEIWFSTPSLVEAYADIDVPARVVRNNLDPRFWRNYRKPVRTSFSPDKVRFLYAGTATHDGDFSVVLPMFERLGKEFPDRFELTLIGAVRNPPKHDWLKRLHPPAEKGAYPQFVRWLGANADFDVGIAPLQASAFNRAKSDIKILDYGALGMLSLVSKGEAYAEAIEAGLAIGCENTVDDWFDKAAQILRNPQSFEEMRERALSYVWDERNTLKSGQVIVDILAGFHGNGVRPKVS